VVFEIVEVVLKFALLVLVQVEKPELKMRGGEREG
jgi:hypothetical protein